MIHTVTMFTKKGCSLCVPVKEAILRTQAAFPVSWARGGLCPGVR